MTPPGPPLKIAVVGPCTAGKSTLVAGLRAAGFEGVRHVAQEHSYVPDMWQRFTAPDVLIYLDVSYEVACQRRVIYWEARRLEQQSERLRHAREHCDLYIDTDSLTVEEVLSKAVEFLEQLPRLR